MALADILELISSDARAEADAIVREAEEAAAATRERAGAEALLAAGEIGRTAAAETASEAETLIAAVRLQARDRAVAARRDLVERVLLDAGEAFVAQPDDRYAAFIARGIVDAARGGERVLVAPADAERLAGRLAAEVARLAAEAGIELELAFADEPAERLARGVLLEGRRVRVEISPAATLAARREDLTMLVSRTLFRGGE